MVYSKLKLYKDFVTSPIKNRSPRTCCPKKKTSKNHPRNDDATTIGASDEETYTFQTTATHAAQGIQWNAPAKSSKNHSKDMSRWMSIFVWIEKLWCLWDIISIFVGGKGRGYRDSLQDIFESMSLCEEMKNQLNLEVTAVFQPAKKGSVLVDHLSLFLPGRFGH